MLRSPPVRRPSPRIVAVVVTYNRKELLLECLRALARQTHPLERVVLVDNASTDGTVEDVERSGIADRLRLELVQLRRNGGGSEGFHYGVREALQRPSDWIWLMDDDCEPRDDALERLLAGETAADPATVALAPAVRDPEGRVLPMHRGHITSRPFRAPMCALRQHDYGRTRAACDFSSFVGPLFRTEAVRRAGPPLREAFIRFEDLEYSARMRPLGRMWLVPDSVVVHKEAVPVTGTDLRTLWRDFSIPSRFDDQWKNVYGLRNVVFAGRRHGFVTWSIVLSYVLVQVARTIAFDERKLRTSFLIAMYAYDGWQGRFRNVPPGRWGEVAASRAVPPAVNARALRYDAEVAQPARALSAVTAAPATPAG